MVSLWPKSLEAAAPVQYKLNFMSEALENKKDLSDLEREVVALFVRVADVLNLPRSVGELYGLLFISPRPLSLDGCRSRLNISKGSTSQGLKILRSFGAIRSVDIPGDRKDYYEAETSLRKVLSGFVREQLQPHVTDGKEQVSSIRDLLSEYSGDEKEVLTEKVDVLENWQKRASRALPVVIKLVGK